MSINCSFSMCTNAADVGGMFSRDHPFCVNIAFLAPFTSSLTLVQSYISTINRWIVSMAVEKLTSSTVGVSVRHLNTSVVSWYAIQVFQAKLHQQTRMSGHTL
ncbi:hypothetical protein OS493_019478 [Desmophyllum pertusum]|uniref:Uncharacterized protein n=1 Tax=Desmophyllum pertusum TaxID=174260 RepID=A0A9W9ZN90_9CNID|nr:hypothetical protein OS493_019478 [Desmophyllum pertusum]